MPDVNKPIEAATPDNGTMDFSLGSVQSGVTEKFNEFNNPDNKQEPNPPVPPEPPKTEGPDNKNKEDESGNGNKNKEVGDDNKNKEEGSKDGENKEGGKTLVVNKDGDLVDDSGSIIRKKGSFDYDEKTGQVSYTESATEQLLTYYRENGFTFKDDNGQDLEFDDTTESLNKINDIVVNSKAKKVLDSVFAKEPVIKEYLLHKQAGGSDSAFFERKVKVFNYENVSVPETDPQGRKGIIKDWLTKVYGNSNELANEMTEAFEAGGKLNEKYITAIDALKSWQKQEELKATQANQQAINANNKKIQEYWEEVQTLVTKGDLDLITIPENERDSFYSALSVPVKDGSSLVDSKIANLSAKQQLILDYLVYKDFNIDALIKVKALSMQADKLGKRVVVVPKVNSTKVPKQNQGVNKIEEFNINNLV